MAYFLEEEMIIITPGKEYRIPPGDYTAVEICEALNEQAGYEAWEWTENHGLRLWPLQRDGVLFLSKDGKTWKEFEPGDEEYLKSGCATEVQTMGPGEEFKGSVHYKVGPEDLK